MPHAQTGQSSAHLRVRAYPDLDSHFNVVSVSATEKEQTFTSCHLLSMPHAQTGLSSAHLHVRAYRDLDSHFTVGFCSGNGKRTNLHLMSPLEYARCSNRSIFCSPACPGISGSWFSFQSGFCSGNRKITNLHLMSPLDYAAMLKQVSLLLTCVSGRIRTWFSFQTGFCSGNRKRKIFIFLLFSKLLRNHRVSPGLRLKKVPVLK